MEYIAWKKEEFGDNWQRFECGDTAALQSAILDLIKTGGDIEVTVPVSYTINVTVSQAPSDVITTELPRPKVREKREEKEKTDEAAQSRPPQDKGAGR